MRRRLTPLHEPRSFDMAVITFCDHNAEHRSALLNNGALLPRNCGKRRAKLQI